MRTTIKPRENGPFKLSAESEEEIKNLLFFNNSPITFSKNIPLCRCGLSSTQPRCDGTHKRVGFNSSNELKKEIIQTYEGIDITVVFNRSICSGAAQCVHKFPKIYTNASEDWVFPNEGSIEEIKESIKNCPSGALSFIENQSTSKTTNTTHSLSISQKGPIYVKGAIDLEVEHWSSYANKEQYALCRCGASKNKPFCDYSHASLEETNNQGVPYTF